MALVVTARPPARIRAAAVTPRRWSATLRWLTWLAGALYALTLVAEALDRLLPPGGPLEPATRTSNVLAGGLMLGVAAVAWLAARDDAGVLLAATLAPILVGARWAASAVLQSLELAVLAAVADLGLGLLVVGAVVWAATGVLVGARAASLSRTADAGVFFRRVAEVTAGLMLGIGVSGATVRAVGASWACQGAFPDCDGFGVLPFGREPLADIQLYHRLLSYVALALTVWLAIEAWRSQRHLAGLALGLVGCSVAEATLGVVSVASGNPLLTQGSHTLGAVGTWSVAVALVVVARRAPQAILAPAFDLPRAALEIQSLSTRRTLAAYVQLTKPRVMSLLLATTATAMVIAARGMPDVGIFVATLLGGALMSGGAGAINHYVDRDIDPLMGRTAWRPIPSGVIAPRRALLFGIALAVLASAVFVVWVNPLAWVLALLGLLGYVFIYTLWLKRSTPSNIVIGGAAGAIPPLVGWAAVTNEVSSLTAWYLFAIIFFWTPPHFWALSLLIRQHYERAGVPMLPVVRGEPETRKQIVLYSVLLVVLTLVLSPFGMMGVPYFVSAVVLGGLFVRGALRLWRQQTREAARSLYLYSILYLFALFAAMAVDRVVTR